MSAMTADEIETFLGRTRQGILIRTNADGTAHGVPVWFDWDGTAVRLFSAASSPKVRQIERDPRISLLVTNDLDEPPAWVRFEGSAVVDREGDAKHLATEVLAPRYWDLDEEDVAATVEQWRAAPGDAFVIIRLEPERIASSG